jgi:hypothetical protein
MSARRRPVAHLPRRSRILFSAISGLVLVLAFAGTVLGHHALPSVGLSCSGTVTWHVDSWTTDNTNNRALAAHVEVWSSLDGGPWANIGDFPSPRRTT